MRSQISTQANNPGECGVEEMIDPDKSKERRKGTKYKEVGRDRRYMYEKGR